MCLAHSETLAITTVTADQLVVGHKVTGQPAPQRSQGSMAQGAPAGVGVDYSGVIDAAQRELLESGRRQEAVDALIIEVESKLALRALARKAKPVATGANRGRGGGGRMNAHEQQIEDGLKNRLTRLRDGTFRFPGEPPVQAPARLSASEAAASVRQNSQHHAAPAPVPRGQPTVGSSSKDGEDSENEGCDDDDDEDSSFAQYYHVSPAQKAFNKESAREWHKHPAKRSRAFVQPPDVLRSGCQPGEADQAATQETDSQKRNRQERVRYNAAKGTAGQEEQKRKKRERSKEVRHQEKLAKQRGSA